MSKEWTINFEEAHDSGLWVKGFMLFCMSITILAALQSAALVTWSYDLPISPYSEIAALWAEWWHLKMQQLGIASLSEWISEVIANLHDDWPVNE